MKSIFFIVLVASTFTASWVGAETVRFEDAAAIVGTSCAKDIDASCRGVNFDSIRLKDCLARNDDTMSPQCKADYPRAFDAIQKRLAARAAVRKICDRDLVKVCGGVQKDEAKALECILTATRGLSPRCNQSISEAGYR